jgi:threonine/homoserine efflux transporter RhtA
MNKLRGVFGLIGSATAATSAVSGLRTAKEDKDKLALLNAIASIVVAVTGALLAVRSLRKDGET